jgi:hypothetical protein
MPTDKEKLWAALDADGELKVREKLAAQLYGRRKVTLVEEWLRQIKTARENAAETKVQRRDVYKIWTMIVTAAVAAIGVMVTVANYFSKSHVCAAFHENSPLAMGQVTARLLRLTIGPCQATSKVHGHEHRGLPIARRARNCVSRRGNPTYQEMPDPIAPKPAHRSFQCNWRNRKPGTLR